MAECGATGASQEPGRCKHHSSIELAGGGATGIGHIQPRDRSSRCSVVLGLAERAPRSDYLAGRRPDVR
jgi:hypothetical protein